jgi:hypothetical protein
MMTYIHISKKEDLGKEASKERRCLLSTQIIAKAQLEYQKDEENMSSTLDTLAEHAKNLVGHKQIEKQNQ